MGKGFEYAHSNLQTGKNKTQFDQLNKDFFTFSLLYFFGECELQTKKYYKAHLK